MHDIIAHLHMSLTGWTWSFGFLHLFISIPTAIHILLRKNDDGAAISWIGLVLLSPFLGSFIYWIFGINRIRRHAKRARPREDEIELNPVDKFKDSVPEKWLALMHSGLSIHKADYLPGNHVKVLVNGDETYPEMLKAIESAQQSVLMSSYIFDYDSAGKKFVDALCAAHKRNVSIHILIDGIGLGYKWRMADWKLRRCGIKTARFFPAKWFSRSRFINLRNHRKILSVDGKVAFIGGINIREGNILKNNPRSPVQDLHFEIRGPVIGQIDRVFAEDWFFSKHKHIRLPPVDTGGDGKIISRILPDGPDENYQKLKWTLLGAINAAEHCIRILTPYFIPDLVLMSALQSASLRGVSVEVIVPARSNILFFNWAMRANFPQLLQFGIKIYQSPKPFDHSKIFLIDNMWSFIGSSNWDARSLDLNFEINMECYDPSLNAQLTEIFEGRRVRADGIRTTKYSLSRQLLYNLFRLVSPYL